MPEPEAPRPSLRIAYLSSDFGVPVVGTGGKSVHLQETVTALRRRGHAVRVFSPAAPAAEEGSEDVHRLAFVGFPEEVARLLEVDLPEPKHLRREWGRILYSEYAQKALLPLLEDFRPDVLYERYSLFGYAGAELARRLGIPLLLEVNAPLAREQATYRELVLERTANALEQRILNAADALFVVSSELGRHARGLGVPAERITVLPNAVDPEQFHPGVSGLDVRARLGLDGKTVVGFVGSLKPWHDVGTLLGAMQLLFAEHPDTHLLVVGTGPREAALRELDEPWLTCTGAVDHERIPELMAAMDVVVVPYGRDSVTYFSPLKLFEAMAMGKPVVGARIGQVAEILGDKKTGLLYEPSSPRDLAARIADILAAPDRGEQLGEAARLEVVQQRTWDRNAGQIESVAARLLATTRP